MSKKGISIGIILLFVLLSSLTAQQNQLPVLKGLYLGQKPPGKKAEKFAEDIITYEPHNSPTFSPDGKEIIICAMEDDDKYYKMVNNTWTRESDLPFEFPGVCNGVFFSPSGERAYFFIWNERNRFYTSTRDNSGWGKLQIMSEDLNTFRSSWQFTSSENENLYFTYDGNLMVSVFDGNIHLKPVNLKLENNENLKGVTPYIAPDESYLIYSLGYKEDEADLHISYRLESNKWTKPVDLGPDINIKGNMDLCPMVSPDGKYMFFISRRPGPDYELFWVDAGFIEDLKPSEILWKSSKKSDSELFDFEPDIRLFLIYAFMNAAGYDFDYTREYDPMRQEIRQYIKNILDNDFKNRIALYFSQSLKDYDHMGWGAFALHLSAPPKLEVYNDCGSFNITDELKNALPLIREFYDKAQIEALWEKYYPAIKINNYAFKPYADLALQQITDYCRVDRSIYYLPGRKIHFMICPQISHSVAFIYSMNEKAMWMIYGPMSGTMANPYPFYHEALHLVVNPIVQENSLSLNRLKDLFKISKYKRSDIYINIEDLVSESLVRTLDKVLYGKYMKIGKEEIYKFVEDEYRLGHILSLSFYERLIEYESNNLPFAYFCRKFLEEIDVENERTRWEKYINDETVII